MVDTAASHTGLLSPGDPFRLVSLTLLNTNELKREGMLGSVERSSRQCHGYQLSTSRDPVQLESNTHAALVVSGSTLSLSGWHGVCHPGLEGGPESHAVQWPSFQQPLLGFQ